MNTTLHDRLWSNGIMLRAGDTELPLQSVDIHATVDANGVVWQVDQTFLNPLEEALEAVYSFPLPAGGAVSAVRIRLGDRVVEAEIKERGQARIEYEEAVASGHTAALVEQERAEIFTVSVGNIHPGESVTVLLTVHDSVSRDGTEASVRMPTLIKNRYVPGGVPDAGRITPPRHDGSVHVASTVSVMFVLPVRDLVCDTVVDAVLSPVSASVTDFSLDRDIVLRWQVPAEDLDAKWTPDRDDPSMGTIEVTVRTDSQPSAGARRRKAVSVLLDRSGSMHGREMELARQVTTDVIASLDADDLVHVLTFDSVIEALDSCEGGLVPATSANKARLVRDLGTVGARGGTELDAAITASGAVLGLVDDMEEADAIERIVVLLTDGAYGDEATAARQREHELRGARVIVVGIGQDMNGYLEILAANGWFTSVPADHRAGDVSKQVCGRISTPAHRNARLEMDGLSDQAPRLAPDIYPGATVELWARAPRPADGATVRVVTDSGVLATVPVRRTEDASATTRWAKSHINSLDWDVMTGNVPADDGEKEIVKVSVRHRVLSKYTAWVAVDRSRTTDTIVPTRVVQPSFDALGGTSMLRSALISPMALPHRSFDMEWSLSLTDAHADRDAGDAFASPSIFWESHAEDPVLAAIVHRLEIILAGGRSALDVSSLLAVLHELREWLEDQDPAAIGKRAHGKIARRLDKLGTVDLPSPTVAWRTGNELLEICRGLVMRDMSRILRKWFP